MPVPVRAVSPKVRVMNEMLRSACGTHRHVLQALQDMHTVHQALHNALCVLSALCGVLSEC